MAKMPSPENSSPSPRRSFSTSFTKDRSAIGSLLHMDAPRGGRMGNFGSDVVLADVAQHLLQRGDEGRIFAVVDVREHRLERIVHGRPGAVELRPAFIGQEYLAHPAVLVAGLAPHQPLRLQR